MKTKEEDLLVIDILELPSKHDGWENLIYIFEDGSKRQVILNKSFNLRLVSLIVDPLVV